MSQTVDTTNNSNRINIKLLNDNLFKAEKLLERVKSKQLRDNEKLQVNQSVNVTKKDEKEVKGNLIKPQGKPVVKTTARLTNKKVGPQPAQSTAKENHQNPSPATKTSNIPVLTKQTNTFPILDSFKLSDYLKPQQNSADFTDLKQKITKIKSKVTKLKQDLSLCEIEKQKVISSLNKKYENNFDEFDKKEYENILKDFDEFDGVNDLVDCFEEKKVLERIVYKAKTKEKVFSGDFKEKPKDGSIEGNVRKIKKKVPIKVVTNETGKKEINHQAKCKEKSNISKHFIPPFYNVKVSDKPVFLKRTTIRPPSFDLMYRTKSPERKKSSEKIIEEKIVKVAKVTQTAEDKATSMTPVNIEDEYMEDPFVMSWLKQEFLQKLKEKHIFPPVKVDTGLNCRSLCIEVINEVVEKELKLICINQLFEHKQRKKRDLAKSVSTDLVESFVNENVKNIVSDALKKTASLTISNTIIDEEIKTVVKETLLEHTSEIKLRIPAVLPIMSEVESSIESSVTVNEIAIQTSLKSSKEDSSKPSTTTTTLTTVISEGEVITDLFSEGQVVDRLDYKIIEDSVLSLRHLKLPDFGSLNAKVVKVNIVEKGEVGVSDVSNKDLKDCSAGEVDYTPKKEITITSPGEKILSPEDNSKPSFIIESSHLHIPFNKSPIQKDFTVDAELISGHESARSILKKISNKDGKDGSSNHTTTVPEFDEMSTFRESELLMLADDERESDEEKMHFD